MEFTIYGVRYDTDEMRGFPTGDPKQPTIYMDRNCRVFVERIQAGKAVIEWATTTEVKSLANRYCIKELERAMRHTDHAEGRRGFEPPGEALPGGGVGAGPG